jgi:hypothetical protein
MNRKSKGLAEAARFELQARLIRKRERCTAQYNALPAVGWEWRTILELCHLSTCRVRCDKPLVFGLRARLVESLWRK